MPIKDCAYYKLTNLGEKDKERSHEWLVTTDPVIHSSLYKESQSTVYYYPTSKPV